MTEMQRPQGASAKPQTLCPTRILLLAPPAGDPGEIKALLQARGYGVSWTHDLAVAACRARSGIVDVALVMGSRDPAALLAGCAALSRHCGVIVLLTADTRALCVEALEAGADDCLATPCNPLEVAARIRAVLRGRRRRARRRWLNDELMIHPAGRVGSIYGGSVELTAVQQRLLETLASHAGQVVTREQLFVAVYGETATLSDRAIDGHVSRLRKRVARLGCQDLVASCRGVGYRLAGQGCNRL